MSEDKKTTIQTTADTICHICGIRLGDEGRSTCSAAHGERFWGKPQTTALTDSETEALIQDLLSSADHCPARDVIAAGLIANMREEINSLKTDLEGAAHNRFYDQADAYFEGVKDERNAD